MKAPAFQLYAGDLFVDTFLWSNRELGAYTRLLLFQWTNGPLPSDINKLAKIACENVRKMTQIWQEIGKKFAKNEQGNFVNLRLEETREKQRKYSEKQRERVQARWEKKDTVVLPTNEPIGYSPSPSPSPTTKNKRIIREIPPKIEDVKSFCSDRNNGIDAEKFFDYYASRGWMIGKNKMKDWKAAVRTWERNNDTNPTTSNNVDAELLEWQKATGRSLNV